VFDPIESIVGLSLDGLSPASGTVMGGGTVTIHGHNFVDGATVLFGSIPATMVQVLSSTTLTAVIPPHLAGVVNVSVSLGTPGCACRTKVLADAYTYVGLPVLPTTGVDPVSGIGGGLILAAFGGLLLAWTRVVRRWTNCAPHIHSVHPVRKLS
jgi:hypothetical protein